MFQKRKAPGGQTETTGMSSSKSPPDRSSSFPHWQRQQVTSCQAIKLIELSFEHISHYKLISFCSEATGRGQRRIALILLLVCFHTLITTTAQAQAQAEAKAEERTAVQYPDRVPAPLLSMALAIVHLSLSLSSSFGLPVTAYSTFPLCIYSKRISRLQFSLAARLIIILYAHVPPLWSYYDQ